MTDVYKINIKNNLKYFKQKNLESLYLSHFTVRIFKKKYSGGYFY